MPNHRRRSLRRASSNSLLRQRQLDDHRAAGNRIAVGLVRQRLWAQQPPGVTLEDTPREREPETSAFFVERLPWPFVCILYGGRFRHGHDGEYTTVGLDSTAVDHDGG